MKKTFITLFICLAPALSFVLAQGSPDDTFRKINGEVRNNFRGYDLLREATATIGHRLTGTENGKKAEEFTYNLFRSFGYEDVSYFNFKVEAWARENIDVEVTSAGKSQALAAVSLAHSPVSADITAGVIDAGNGLRSDFETKKDRIKGRIALVNIGIYPKDSLLKNLHRSEKMALAVQYGVAGVIFVNTVEGNILLTGTASVDGSLLKAPAACISLEDGTMIREWMKQGNAVTARILMKNKSETIQARNVIATLKGSELAGEEILLVGHLDSWDLATGAIDNGLGSFTILEIARAFKKLNLKPKRTIRFVLFMGEEQGLLGSKAYVKHRVKDGTLDKIRYLINLDMAGNTSGFNALGRDEMSAFIKEISGKIKSTDSSFKNTFTNRLSSLHSDHQPFVMQGIPVLGTQSNLDPPVYKFYHSNKDDFSLVNAEHMNACARFVGMMLYALADADEIPARRYPDEQTRAYLEKFNLREELMLAKEWRWEDATGNR